MTADQWVLLGVVFFLALGTIIVGAIIYQWYSSPKPTKARQLKKIRKSQRQFSDW